MAFPLPLFLCKTNNRSKVWGSCMSLVESRSHVPHLLQGRLETWTSHRLCQDSEWSRPKPRKESQTMGSQKHSREGGCGMWTKPSTTTQLGSCYFLHSTQTLGFLPTWPRRGVNYCQYLLSLGFYLFTFIFSLSLYLLYYIFILGLEMLPCFFNCS